MSMHIEGPWLTTTGRRRAKQKWASAEHKRRHEQLEAEWQQLKQKHAATPAATTKRPMVTGLAKSYKLSIPEWRQTKHIPSLSTGGGVAARREPPVYTGAKVKGIGTMHKSNVVPIFSDEEAVEISQMRRG